MERTEPSKVRSQLLKLGERFIGFDKLVEAESRNARQNEARRSDQLVSAINDLEKGIHGEIKARAEANRQFQADIELFSNTVFEKMQNRVGKRLERLLGEIDMLETRCVTLERGLQQFRGEVPSKLLVDTAALVKEMNDLKSHLQDDVQVWRARESALMRKLDASLKNVVLSVEKFETAESDLLSKLRADMQQLTSANHVKHETVVGEISLIRQSIQLEEETRKFADSEILAAVNSYSDVLQKGLRDLVGTR
jgi:hypothetical protein